MVWNAKNIVDSINASGVANYITKLRGLKPAEFFICENAEIGCKLYHKTTWFETTPAQMPEQALSKLQIISQNYVVWNFATRQSNRIRNPLQIISQNYVVWNVRRNDGSFEVSGCKLYHKTTWFETLIVY